MTKQIVNLSTALALLLSILVSQPAAAVGHPYEFAVDAKMAINGNVPVSKTYGYMTVTTDRHGNGSIDVMFSNGNRSKSARFNARVKFLDAAGAVIREEYFNHWLAAAEFDEAVEGKVTKPLPLSVFESIQVDFYLSDISGPTAANDDRDVRISNASGYTSD